MSSIETGTEYQANGRLPAGGLLSSVLDARGGLENWSTVTELTAQLSLGGPFWAARGWPDVASTSRSRRSPRKGGRRSSTSIPSAWRSARRTGLAWRALRSTCTTPMGSPTRASRRSRSTSTTPRSNAPMKYAWDTAETLHTDRRSARSVTRGANNQRRRAR